LSLEVTSYARGHCARATNLLIPLIRVEPRHADLDQIRAVNAIRTRLLAIHAMGTRYSLGMVGAECAPPRLAQAGVSAARLINAARAFRSAFCA